MAKIKLTGTQKSLLDAVEHNQEALLEASKNYWENIKLPAGAAAVPYVRAIGKRQEEAAAGLVAAGIFAQISVNSFTTTFGYKSKL